MAEKDAVDRIIEQWNHERPDLDVAPMGIIGRIGRLEKLLDPLLYAVFKRYGLHGGEFDVLATLRRAGTPYRLTPTALFQTMMVSSGGMTNRIDRLESAGLVLRQPDPNDRRGTLVGLTEKGLELVNRAVEDHLANEQRLLTGLDADEQAALTALLKKWLLALED
jgi:DNA-binding MarR family transcriptional regulator